MCTIYNIYIYDICSRRSRRYNGSIGIPSLIHDTAHELFHLRLHSVQLGLLLKPNLFHLLLQGQVFFGQRRVHLQHGVQIVQSLLLTASSTESMCVCEHVCEPTFSPWTLCALCRDFSLPHLRLCHIFRLAKKTKTRMMSLGATFPSLRSEAVLLLR